MGAEHADLGLHFVQENRQLYRKDAHTTEMVPWIGWLDDGNQLLTMGTSEDGTNETILWDTQVPNHPASWTVIFKLKDKFLMVLNYRK